MNTSLDKIDLGELAERLRKAWLFICVGIIVGLQWVFLNLLLGLDKETLYQKEMLYVVNINEEICSLRQGDLEQCLYGEDKGVQLAKEQKIDEYGLRQKVILIITEPGESNKQVKNFKIFIRANTPYKIESLYHKIEKNFYFRINQKVLSGLNNNMENLKKDITAYKDDEIFRLLYSRLEKLGQYKQLILEGSIPVIEKLSQTQPEVIWQIPNILFDLPSGIIIGLASGIAMAVVWGKYNLDLYYAS